MKVFTEKVERLAVFCGFAELVSIAIEPSLYVCAYCGCKVYEGGYGEVINGEETTVCCMHCAQSYKEIKNLPKKPHKKLAEELNVFLLSRIYLQD